MKKLYFILANFIAIPALIILFFQTIGTDSNGFGALIKAFGFSYIIIGIAIWLPLNILLNIFYKRNKKNKFRILLSLMIIMQISPIIYYFGKKIILDYKINTNFKKQVEENKQNKQECLLGGGKWSIAPSSTFIPPDCQNLLREKNDGYRYGSFKNEYCQCNSDSKCWNGHDCIEYKEYKN